MPRRALLSAACVALLLMPPEIILPARRGAVLAADGVAPLAPFQFVLSTFERLRVLTYSDDASAVYTIAGRVHRGDGTISTFAFQHAQVSENSSPLKDVNVGAGALLTVSVYVSTQNGVSRHGRNWVRVQVIQGEGAAATVLGTLVQAYVTKQDPVAWPGTPFRSPTEGPGLVEFIEGTAPAAGGAAELTFTPDRRYRIDALSVIFDTAAGGSARRVFVRQVTANGVDALFPAPFPQPASTTQTYVFGRGLPNLDASANGMVAGALPIELWSTNVSSYEVNAALIAAADQFTAVGAQVTRWFDPS